MLTRFMTFKNIKSNFKHYFAYRVFEKQRKLVRTETFKLNSSPKKAVLVKLAFTATRAVFVNKSKFVDKSKISFLNITNILFLLAISKCYQPGIYKSVIIRVRNRSKLVERSLFATIDLFLGAKSITSYFVWHVWG